LKLPVTAFEIASRFRRAPSPLLSEGMGGTGARYGRSDVPGMTERVSRVVEDKINNVGGSTELCDDNITEHADLRDWNTYNHDKFLVSLKLHCTIRNRSSPNDLMSRQRIHHKDASSVMSLIIRFIHPMHQKNQNKKQEELKTYKTPIRGLSPLKGSFAPFLLGPGRIVACITLPVHSGSTLDPSTELRPVLMLRTSSRDSRSVQSQILNAVV
jgi:hypothetical protein